MPAFFIPPRNRGFAEFHDVARGVGYRITPLSQKCTTWIFGNTFEWYTMCVNPILTEQNLRKSKQRNQLVKRALVVDDEEFMIRLFENLLEMMQIECVSFSDPTLALTELTISKFNYLITDLMMPNVDGIELCRKVREDMGLEELRIIMVTSKKLDVDERKELMKLRVSLMVKPISPSSFIEQVRGSVDSKTV